MEHGAVLELTDAAVQCLVADEDAEKSGAGRMPSAGAVRLRVAISTRASARRWPEVRASSSILAVRPRRSLACAQSASKRSCSRRLSSPATTEPEMGSRVIWPSHMPPRLDSKKTLRAALRSSSEASAPSGSASCFQYSSTRAKSSKPSSLAWETNISSSRARAASLRCRRAAARARAWSLPMVPSRQAWATSGRCPSVRPRRTRRLAARRATRQRVAIQLAAVLAPSAAHSSPTSKAAVASVTKESRRDWSWCSSTIDPQSP